MGGGECAFGEAGELASPVDSHNEGSILSVEENRASKVRASDGTAILRARDPLPSFPTAGSYDALLVGGELPSSRGRLVGSPLPAPGCLACHGSGKGGWGPPLPGEVLCRSTEGELRDERREGR